MIMNKQPDMSTLRHVPYWASHLSMAYCFASFTHKIEEVKFWNAAGRII